MNTLNLMKNYLYRAKALTSGILLTFVLVFSFLMIKPILYVHADSTSQKVYDNAGLLTSEELMSLESAALEIGEKYNTDIYILTDEDSDGKSRKVYMEDFADEKEVTDSTIIFVNMESGNRGVEIQGYGTNKSLINSSRIEYILDDVTPYLSDEEYYQAFVTFLEEVDYYLGIDPSKDTATHAPDNNYASSDKYYEEENGANSILSEFWVQLIIALVIGGIAVGIMAFNSGGRVTVNERTYLDANHSRVIAQRDDYIRTTTTKTRRPQNNNNRSGGGGSGVSSGGRSHSGGGRSF
ncbi:uncharacterized protein EDD66_101331 [Mobilisporobacter senegalensis]|uniref:TPM domain-containing protein n=1 Tax=Mobilisporobacter senegalensis TaxID=1329262 RepID=A0A3N1XYN2_9FIRM|nr:TPM domain-containing protein [Mobilisporobacter senegalensis]ROR31713.1 uncharacterized protein EDD66_101331 [Mobilisporobacter senegalensis]